MASYFHRYQAGEYEQVWAELCALGAEVREEPVYSDALAVAQETMERARQNVECIISRLQEIGYRFDSTSEPSDVGVEELTTPVFALPPVDVQDRLSELERLVGPLPLSLRLLYETVGAVNLVGRSPAHWHLDHARDDYKLDPLYIYPLEIACDEYKEWRDRCAEEPDVRFAFPIAPDLYHKYNISGGMWYHMVLPQPSADGLLAAEWHNTTLVNYLRVCFRWGGLPGLERLSHHQEQDVAFLTQGLMPV